MKPDADPSTEAMKLRVRALAHLTEGVSPEPARAATSDALGVLFRLASSPVTASSALALLHEMQVLQVEVDMQDDDLRRSRIELEARILRQQVLYDFCPVGYLTLDAHGMVQGLNRAAVALLAGERGSPLGQALQPWFAAESAERFDALLARLKQGAASARADLELTASALQRVRVHALACHDPAGTGYLLTLMDDATGMEDATGSHLH